MSSSSVEATATAGFRGRRRRVPAVWLDTQILRMCQRLIGGRTAGDLQLQLPSGVEGLIAGGTSGVSAQLSLTSHAVFRKALSRGSIGFAEAFVLGEIDSSDPVTLFKFFIDNKDALQRAGRGYFRVRAQDKRYHAKRANTRSGSRSNIKSHYDLGNSFYRLWLDSSMTYSSGIFLDPDTSLEAAQAEKYLQICAALEGQSGDSVLEIGCGWGAMAEHLAARGLRVTGLTLSDEQLAAARSRLAAAGFSERTDVRLQDYRDVGGKFDRLVSIEMIEAVGEEHWPIYFQAISDRLKAGGIAVLQAITIREDLFESYRSKADFIQRYVFPGGMLPTADAIRHHAEAVGLSYEQVVTFGPSYARTLREWRRRFDAAWPEIEALGFDERFRRMWTYYLTYCEAGFDRGTVDVGVYRLRKIR